MYPILKRRSYFILIQSFRKFSDSIDLIDINRPFNPTALDNVANDISDIHPFLPPTFNLAAYVNKSKLLQSLVDLNVNLSKIEKKPYITVKLLKLDFEKDVKKHIWFFKDYVDDLGTFITKNPMILCEPLEDLQVRINYLQSKQFSEPQIKRIVSKNQFWLMFSSLRIDRRLGFYQDTFSLSGEEVRALATHEPRLITYSLQHVKTNQFAIKEEMGFEDGEIKKLLLKKPKLWMLNQLNLLRRFNYIHHEMKISHEVILSNPGALLCRNYRLKQRHLFLTNLGRAQYNPSKENYVPIKALFEGTDSDFCTNYAKCNVRDYNLFLKTL